MSTTHTIPWYEARKAPFEAFGILYYPLFAHRADLEGIELDGEDMTWAVTANTNLGGTGYTLSQPSILALAAYHHHMAVLAAGTSFLPVAEGLGEKGVNPLADLKRFVPDVKATPMYPDFPSQVMDMDEATFRFHQAMHYLSTYGVELLAGLHGLDVTVDEGWLPDVESTPKTKSDETLVAPKVLHLILTVEDLRSVVEARLGRATRMHPAEMQTTLEVFSDLGEEDVQTGFPKVAFHENMMELIRIASEGDSRMLTRVAGGLAQHPGDLLKATQYVLAARGATGHLATRQKKGLCRAFERFSAMSIACNIVDAGKKDRKATNYLSIERFAGPHLRKACELVWSGQVVSWATRLEQLWQAVEEAKQPARSEVDDALNTYKTTLPERLRDAFARLIKHENKRTDEAPDQLEVAWQALLAHYGMRPGMLFRSLNRLVKNKCPEVMLRGELSRHAKSYSLPTLVRTLTIMSEATPRYRLGSSGYAAFHIEQPNEPPANARLRRIIRDLVVLRLRELDTPLKGKSIYLQTAGVSLAGSILMPNDAGSTGTAWPPVGIAYELPDDQTVRFFTFWDERRTRVDVDLHFVGLAKDGKPINIGWNSRYATNSMVTSGDITTSHNSVEYLDAHMGKARDEGVRFVVQHQHIFSGARDWNDISTCYSGALVVKGTDTNVTLYNPENLLFRDDLTGKGTNMDYAVVDFDGHYVRILRGADLPLGEVGFSLGDYLAALFEAQDATLAATPEDADVCVCVGRSDDPAVISLFDEGFFIG
ncbi:MAG: hypothetical protein IKG21_09765 [Atopobiaceae bacterium]|nr:hypothetical protein [Atopobiaceae bacterium]